MIAPPVASVPKTSYTDKSNATEATASTLSDGRMSKLPAIHLTKLTAEAWLTTTPFGCPVLPDVNMM